MSGFEVVGLVLAIAPLVISGLEHYKGGLNSYRVFKKYGEYLDELICQLRQQQVDFQQNVWLLTEAADLGPASFSVYNETLWKEGGMIEDAIEQQLGVASEEYKRTVKAYFWLLESIVSELKHLRGVDDVDSKASFRHDYEAILQLNSSVDGKFSFAKRLKFTMKRKEIKELIVKLKESNNTLERFQSKADSIRQRESERPTRFSEKLYQTYRSIRVHACGLYESFSRALKPNCHPAHDISLQLEPRLPQRGHRAAKVNFKILLAAQQAKKAELSISILHENAATSSEPQHQSQPKSAGRIPRFALPNAQPQSTTVNDLCDIINKAVIEQAGIQFHLDQNQKLVYIKNDSLSSLTLSSDEFVTLETLLLNRRLALRARMRLALILSSALLQLCNTPWLNTSCWAKRSIHFRAQHQPPLNPQAGCFLKTEDDHQPFITQRFLQNTGQSNSPSHVDARWSLLELGILLVELCLNTTLEQHYQEEPAIRTQNQYIRQALALQWVDEARDDIYPETVWLAARSCIACQFSNEISHPPIWDNEDLQHAVCKTVIATLSEGLQPILST